MKKTPILILIMFSLSILLYGQRGHVYKNQSFESKVLSDVIKYNIYLPPGYNEHKELPILYYLHGFGGNHFSSLKIMNIIDSMIVNKTFPEMIVVTPDAKKTWYLDNADGSVKYGSMFIEEFKPFIEKEYSVSKLAQKTVISGSSMGGIGAIRFSMLYPEQFGICIGFQSALDTKEQFLNMPEDDYKKFHEHIYGIKETKEERINTFFYKNNPLYIAQELSLDKLNSVKWYIQCCDNDYHSLPNAELHILFHKKKIEHEYRVTNGGHNRKCVMCSLQDALAFVRSNLSE